MVSQTLFIAAVVFVIVLVVSAYLAAKLVGRSTSTPDSAVGQRQSKGARTRVDDE